MALTLLPLVFPFALANDNADCPSINPGGISESEPEQIVFVTLQAFEDNAVTYLGFVFVPE
jgi:hypothetical protein